MNTRQRIGLILFLMGMIGISTDLIMGSMTTTTEWLGIAFSSVGGTLFVFPE